MRQSKLVLFIISAGLAAVVGCATTNIDEFVKVKDGMSKDQVLEIIGSPVRTERFDGKEKWAYRYWGGDNKDIEELRQVTFINGKVVSEGEDKDEIERIKQISETDAQRAERRKAAKSAPPMTAADLSSTANSSSGTTSANGSGGSSGVSDPDQELRDHVQQFIPKESDFVEVKGKRTKPKSADDDSEDAQ